MGEEQFACFERLLLHGIVVIVVLVLVVVVVAVGGVVDVAGGIESELSVRSFVDAPATLRASIRYFRLVLQPGFSGTACMQAAF